MTQVVSFTRQGSIGVIALNNPPVNALSHAVRSGIRGALASALADSDVQAIVIWCEGRTFVAGADIREFGKPPLAPDVPEVVELVGASSKPVIAALHGTALGGGLELALACDFRIAAASTKLGLPEVTLGILPGAGGTQRLPRLVGVRAALDLIVGGALIGAAKALALGLIDEVVEGELQPAALLFAERMVAEQRPLRKASDRSVALDDPDLFEAYARDVARDQRGFLAPLRCIQAVRAAVELPFEAGLLRERELFGELMASPESKAQRHVFFAEREVLKPPGLSPDVVPRAVRTAGVVGDGSAGGSAIVACFAAARIPAVLVGTTRQNLDRELAALRRHYASAVAAGTLTNATAEERLASIRSSLAYEDLADVDLVVEAVSDDLASKREVFWALDAHARPGAIWATNTASLDIDEVAEATARPEDFAGMHFFDRANAVKGLENTQGQRTLPDVCASLMKLGRALGKVPVLVKAGAGPASHRMLEQYWRQAFLLIEEGALPADVDRVLYDFGFPSGPFAAREDLLVEPPGARGSTRRAPDDREILERCLYAIVNEGARILEEGVASRPLEIDMLWVHGLGFPAYRGGPMFWADQIGLGSIHQATLVYRERLGAGAWTPAPRLERLAGESRGFYG
jgi:3-hydroxyacyl-CoA dehydrogenase